MAGSETMVLTDLDPGIGWSAEQIEQLRTLGEYRHVSSRPTAVADAVRLLVNSHVVIMPPLNGSLGEAELAALPQLRGIATSSTSTAWIDLVAAYRNGVLVSPASSYASTSVAEFVFAALLYESRRLDAVLGPESETRRTMNGRDLAGRNLGVVGLGPIGRRCVELGTAFGMHVRVHNRTRRVSGLQYHRLKEVLAWAHAIIVCVARTPDTMALINRVNAAHIRQGAIVISVSREGVVDAEALSGCVAQGRVARFIFEADMITNHEYATSTCVPCDITRTPHVAWYTAEAEGRLRDEVLRNVTNMAAIIAAPRMQGRAREGGGR